MEKLFFAMILASLVLAACVKPQPVVKEAAAPASPPPAPIGEQQPVSAKPGIDAARLLAALYAAAIPQDMASRVQAAARTTAFSDALSKALEGDPILRYLVDKSHPLPDGYAPSDLVELKDGSYQIGRKGLMLRNDAADALEAMGKAAKADGVTLIASSTYRSYAYQVTVYNRVVKEIGQEAADRESARPGMSQHQTGLVVDFGSIDDSFAETKAGRWMLANAGRFGWSLSFPDGYENITGYRWESWHYRYVGKALASFIDTYFSEAGPDGGSGSSGIQQYALQFLHEWEKR